MFADELQPKVRSSKRQPQQGVEEESSTQISSVANDAGLDLEASASAAFATRAKQIASDGLAIPPGVRKPARRLFDVDDAGNGHGSSSEVAEPVLEAAPNAAAIARARSAAEERVRRKVRRKVEKQAVVEEPGSPEITMTIREDEASPQFNMPTPERTELWQLALARAQAAPQPPGMNRESIQQLNDRAALQQFKSRQAIHQFKNAVNLAVNTYASTSRENSPEKPNAVVNDATLQRAKSGGSDAVGLWI